MALPKVVPLTRQLRPDGFYFRVRHNDHVGLARLLAERRVHADGLVFDARYEQRHDALRRDAGAAGVATWLDTQAMELAMPGAFSKGRSELPWAHKQSHKAEDFTPGYRLKFIDAIVACTLAGEFRCVMAPTHYLDHADSDWVSVDRELVLLLRDKLDAAGAHRVDVVYPLAVHGKLFYSEKERMALKRALKGLPIDGISLRVHPFGGSAGPQVMRAYIEASRDLQELNLPISIERAGLAGLVAYALGAVNRVESGIVFGDSFDVSDWQKPRLKKSSRFSPPERVYVEALGTTLELELAAHLVESSHGKLRFACKVPECCPGGARDMLADAHRHSVLARQREYAALAKIPRTMRAEQFIQTMLAPVCDMLARASDLHEPLTRAHRRMLSVKETLIDMHREYERRRRSQPLVTTVPDARPSAQVLTLTPRDPMGR